MLRSRASRTEVASVPYRAWDAWTPQLHSSGTTVAPRPARTARLISPDAPAPLLLVGIRVTRGITLQPSVLDRRDSDAAQCDSPSVIENGRRWEDARRGSSRVARNHGLGSVTL